MKDYIFLNEPFFRWAMGKSQAGYIEPLSDDEEAFLVDQFKDEGIRDIFDFEARYIDPYRGKDLKTLELIARVSSRALSPFLGPTFHFTVSTPPAYEALKWTLFQVSLLSGKLPGLFERMPDSERTVIEFVFLAKRPWRQCLYCGGYLPSERNRYYHVPGCEGEDHADGCCQRSWGRQKDALCKAVSRAKSEGEAIGKFLEKCDRLYELNGQIRKHPIRGDAEAP